MIFLKSISTYEKFFFGKNKNHPQFLYHIDQWKNTGTFDFEMFCYFQPYLPPDPHCPRNNVIFLEASFRWVFSCRNFLANKSHRSLWENVGEKLCWKVLKLIFCGLCMRSWSNLEVGNLKIHLFFVGICWARMKNKCLDVIRGQKIHADNHKL